MNKLIQIFTQIVLIVVGAFFFFCMLLFGAISMFVFLMRVLWHSITGKKPPKRTQGFAQPNGGGATSPRPSQRDMDDVTDVEIKELYQPDDRPE